MRNPRRLAIIVATFSLGALVAACQKKDQPSPGTSHSASASAKPSASASASARQGRSDGSKGTGRDQFGFAQRFIDLALDKLALPADSRKRVEALRDEGKVSREAGMKTAREGRVAFRKELVATVKAGKVDPKAFDKLLVELDKANAKRREDALATLGKLHSVLNADQRKKLVTEVKTWVAKRDEASKSRLDTWKAKHGEKAGAPHFKGRIARMLEVIKLTDEETKKLDGILAKGKPAAEHWKAFREEAKKGLEQLLSEFEKEKLDTAKLAVAKPHKEHQAGLTKHLELMGQVLAVLTSDQRAELARKLESGEGRHGIEFGGLDDLANLPSPAVGSDSKK